MIGRLMVLAAFVTAVAGCVHAPVTSPAAPATAPGPAAAPAPVPAAPPATPAAVANPKAPPLAKVRKPAPPPSRPAAASSAPVAPPQSATSVRPPAPAPAAAPALDLPALEQRLRDTKAIGVFTKLSLKNQVDDLVGRFRDFYARKGSTSLSELRQRYDLLLLKVLSVLQDGDPALAAAIAASREALWGILADPQKFGKLGI